MQSMTGTGTRRALAITIAATLGLAGTACSSDDAASDDPTTTAEAEEDSTTSALDETTTTAPAVVNSGAAVELIDFQYLPPDIEIAAGESVTWTNNGENRHTVTSADGTFSSSDTINPGQAFLQAFPTPGTYLYFCTFHDERMEGAIVVS